MGVQVSKGEMVKGMHIGDRPVGNVWAARGATRYALGLDKAGGSPVAALNAIMTRLERDPFTKSGDNHYKRGIKDYFQGIVYQIPTKRDNDRAALVIAAFEILENPFAYPHGGDARDKAFKALYLVCKESVRSGANEIETALNKQGVGSAKVDTLEYVLVNGVNDQWAKRRVSDFLDNKVAGLNLDQKLWALNLIETHAKAVNITLSRIEMQIKDVYMKKGAEAEETGRYGNAVEHYGLALEYCLRGIGRGEKPFMVADAVAKVIDVASGIDGRAIEKGRAAVCSAIPEISNFYTYALDLFGNMADKYGNIKGDSNVKVAEFAVRQMTVLQTKMKETGSKLMNAGKRCEKDADYAGALEAYMLAANLHEIVSERLSKGKSDEAAKALETEGLAPVKAIMNLGDAIMKRANTVVEGAKKLGEEVAQLDKKAEELKLEADKLTDTAAEAKYNEAEVACRESIKKVDEALNLRAEATGLANKAEAAFSVAAELYEKKQLSEEAAKAKEKRTAAIDVANGLREGSEITQLTKA